MTNMEQSKGAPSTALLSAALAFGGLLLLSAAVVLMTRLAEAYAEREAATRAPVATPVVAPVTAAEPKAEPATPAVAPAATAEPKAEPAADTSATPADADAPVAAAEPKAEPAADVAAPQSGVSSKGPWVITLNPETNEPDAAGLQYIAAISAALDADPRATVTLVGVNHFRKSSKRAQAAAQSVLERLRDHNGAHAKRATAVGEQTKDAEGLIVRATIQGGGK